MPNPTGVAGRDVVETAPLQVRLKELIVPGRSFTDVARELGVTKATLGRVYRGTSLHTEVWLADLILSLPESASLADHFVDSRGTYRRIEALMWCGYSARRQDKLLGGGHLVANLTTKHRRGPRVARESYERIRAVYGTYITVPPEKAPFNPGANGISRTRGEARRRGFQPPGVWEDIDNDEHPLDAGESVREGVDLVAVERRMSGDRSARLNRAEKRELARMWSASGGTATAFERVTGMRFERYATEEAA